MCDHGGVLRPPVGSWRPPPAHLLVLITGALLAVAPWLLVLSEGHEAGIDRVTTGTATLIVALVIFGVGNLVARTAWRRRDARTMVGAFAIAFATLLLTGMGFALTGDAPGDAAIIRLPALLVVPGCAAILLLTRVREVVRPGRELVVARTGLITLLVTAVVLVAINAEPELLPLTIPASDTTALVLFVPAALLVGMLTRTAVRTALLTRRPIDALLCVALPWLVPAHFAIATGLPGDARWAVGHGIEFTAFLMIAVHTATDLSRRVSSGALTGGMPTSTLIDRSAEFLGARVSALVERLMEKDPSTAGHVQRVAMLAVQMGEHLKLPTGRLRLLAAGGLLHDIGKLAVPEEILRKPLQLSDEEFAVVQRHPVDGRLLLSELGGFHELVLELVESHHERLDGTGYPHGRSAQELPLEVRILAVADVFDALTTDRPYRSAVDALDALDELAAQAGSGLDPRCIAALREVLDRRGFVAIPRRVDVPRVLARQQPV